MFEKEGSCTMCGKSVVLGQLTFEQTSTGGCFIIKPVVCEDCSPLASMDLLMEHWGIEGKKFMVPQGVNDAGN